MGATLESPITKLSKEEKAAKKAAKAEKLAKKEAKIAAKLAAKDVAAEPPEPVDEEVEQADVEENEVEEAADDGFKVHKYVPPPEPEDETLQCRDCGGDFIFTVGEQEFFKSKGFDNKKTRCAEAIARRNVLSLARKVARAVAAAWPALPSSLVFVPFECTTFVTV
ncbi:hypothetical protein EMIHUDRAFT_196812 [Emiliania huxleyi CCMP1516]|uniref:Probable zinc-binding domain-containing protein n=2 Tax=Emiliania huxleyi TaxID=2903 RepID=A0A0D3J4R5_EMIH1|nr:hypothetical protein EMIHUDRAFT_196812 [Emiliania huxleyi CCMP1516]EOD18500.1 hypothetical protein EMIHUDRAFT_196812 [Emiliania huxleyi CCMP1516]|eukprot:XP_005770929.1 hypothetical protein EMIHUDRAFT_196812 [Emiliania huxleyi CCMP1516]